jgi:D-alanyl-D-alanine carboxypeptidase
MSLQAVLARISEIQGAMAPVQPVQERGPSPSLQPSGSDSFANQLQSAVSSGAGAAQPAAFGKQAAPGTYPHLDGDLDASPEILQKLEALAAKKGMKFHINSGHRSIEEQQRLWDNRANNPLPVAPPGKSRHQSGRACDVSIGGRPIQAVISAAEIRAAGLVPLAGDAPHVELP